MKKPFLHVNQRRAEPMAFVPVIRGNNRLEVRNKGDENEILLIGAIGKSWWDDSGITEQEIRDALKSIPKGKPVTIKINSEGGSVKEGLGIYNAFKERSSDLTARVTGYALSIASVFPLAASKVVSPKSAIWMIHKAWSWAQGNADDMQQAAEMLDAHDQTLAEIYAEHTGKSKAECLDCMAAETWIRGSAAVDFGLADEGDEEDDSQAAYRPLPKAYLDRCANLSPEILNMISAPMQGAVSAPTAGKQHQHKDKIIMDRNEMIALLKQWGVTFNESANDAELKALVKAGKPVPVPIQPAPAPVAQAIPVAVVSLEEFRQEKRKRVRGEILRRAENKIANDKLEWWIDLAMRDGEEGVYAQIDAMPAQNPGGAPIGGTAIQITAEGPMDVIRNQHKTAKARYEAMAGDWNNILIDASKRDVRAGLIKDELFCALARAGVNPFSMSRTQFPVASNTITSVLTNFLIDGSVTDLQNRWAMLRAFSLDTRPDGYKPLAPGVLKHVTVGATAQTNPTNYESGDSTVAPVTITPAEHSVSYQISNTDLNSGVRMTDLVIKNTANFANVVIEAANAVITTANFGAATVVSAAAAFSFSDLATLQAALKKSPIKNLIIDGAYIARISNTPGFFQTAGTVGGSPQAWKAFGWDGIYQSTDWTGAATSAQGFACNPQAIGGIIGLPLLPALIPGNILASNTVTIEGLDIQVLAEAWFNPATRTSWNSLRCIDGWAAVDKTAGFILTSS